MRWRLKLSVTSSSADIPDALTPSLMLMTVRSSRSLRLPGGAPPPPRLRLTPLRGEGAGRPGGATHAPSMSTSSASFASAATAAMITALADLGVFAVPLVRVATFLMRTGSSFAMQTGPGGGTDVLVTRSSLRAISASMWRDWSVTAGACTAEGGDDLILKNLAMKAADRFVMPEKFIIIQCDEGDRSKVAGSGVE